MKYTAVLILLVFSLIIVASAQDEPTVWVESSSTTQIKLGYSGFEPGEQPGYLWVNENSGTRYVDLYVPENDTEYIFGDIFTQFYCDSAKVIVFGYVYGSNGETVRVPEVEVSCHTVRFPILISN